MRFFNTLAKVQHEFHQLCAELAIKHRLTPPKSPQSNNKVERFNSRIYDVLRTNRFDRALDREQTLLNAQLQNAQMTPNESDEV